MYILVVPVFLKSACPEVRYTQHQIPENSPDKLLEVEVDKVGTSTCSLEWKEGTWRAGLQA